MTQSDVRPTSGDTRANWIRLRTMIMLRWVAITGQLIAITVAQQLYSLQLELGLCYAVIGASVVANITAIFVFPENKRLSEGENLAMVLFDLLQLGVLLFLTGGLHNPFSLLVLGPVAVSAAVLSLRSTIVLGGTAIVLVSVLARFHILLTTDMGFVLRIPDVFVFGNWCALVIGIAFISAYSLRVSAEMYSMSDALAATQMALAREQKLTDLGGVVAAAAHELGTPLATIKLASGELFSELDDRPDLQEDAALIRQQADRCRDILRDMGRAGKDDLHMRQAPLMTVIQEAADPHTTRGINVEFRLNGTQSQEPTVLRKPEIIHGLRNLVQNAVDFSKTTVWIEADWTDSVVSVRILDDGRGFPPSLLGRLGDPFMGRRRAAPSSRQRAEYEGMGLGLFIAKTLLERSGASLSFANGNDLNRAKFAIGAIVKVTWPRAAIDPRQNNLPQALGPNHKFQI